MQVTAQILPFLQDWGYHLAGLSVLTLVGTILVIPWLITKIPEDYFIDVKRHESRLRAYHPAVYITILVIKNLFGIFCFVIGLAMLVLPGQGLLTMLIGVLLINFPGKYRFERWLISKDSVYKSINWIRRRSGKPDLLRPDGSERPL